MSALLPPTPSMQKRLLKGMGIYQEKGSDPAVDYLAQAFTAVEELERVLPGATLPTRVLVESAQNIIRDRKARKAIKLKAESEAAAEGRRQLAEEARIRDQEISENLAALTDPGQRIRYIASLAPEDRVRFASKQEQRACIELRKQCVTTSKARALISATQTEFDRWVDEGLLTHVFTRRISVGKMVNARYWSTAELVAFQGQVTMLREVWATRKKARRTNLKLVCA